jgi:hypothetical protein
MRRIFALLLLAAAVAATAGCGGGSSGSTAGTSPAAVVETQSAETVGGAAPPGSIRTLLAEQPGPDVALVFGTAEYLPGENRVSFLVVDNQGYLVHAPRARVLVAKGSLDAVPTIEGQARDLEVGATARDADPSDFDAPSVYVTHVDLPSPGTYTMLVEPQGKEIQAVGTLEVSADSQTPKVGDPAIPSDNPTLRDGFAQDITTARPPDTELLRYSIAQSLAEHVPFVAVFATPKFCESRVCGPVVNVVDEARRRLAGSGVRFIHVEVYEHNDPQQGFNRWFSEWKLSHEPYTFLVGADGLIKARFEGLVTVGELVDAVERDLIRR